MNALADAGLQCIGLKGWEFRKLYPVPAMRQMSNLDILVNLNAFGTIKAAMEGIGYRGGVKGNLRQAFKFSIFRKPGIMRQDIEATQ